MLKNNIIRLLATICLTQVISCGKDNNPTNPPPIEAEYTLEEHVHELPQETTNRITQYNPTTGQIIFQAQQDVQNLRTGDIFISGISENTPNGLLRKIDEIQNNTLETSQTTINDAIKECNFHVENNRLTPTNKSLTKNGFDFEIPFTNIVLYDQDGNENTTNDQVTLEGNLSFNTEVTDFDLVADVSGIQEFTFNTNSTQELSLTLNSETSIELSRTYQLYPDIYCTPIPVGPFLLIPVIEINATIEGQVSVSNAHISQTANLQAGINYSDNTWNPSSNFTNIFDYQLPTFSEQATAKLSIGPKVKLLVYNLAGISSEVAGYLKAEVNPTQNPWWKLYGGLEASIGANLEFFGWPIAEYSTQIADLEELIAQSELNENRAPNPPIFPTPENRATNIELNPNLAWACFDPEEDPLTYDVYFGTLETPTTLIADNISINYLQLNDLESATTYYWKIIANDSEYETPSIVWNFTTKDETPQPEIVFVSERDGNKEIYTMTLDGENQTRVTNNTFSDENPVFTLDNRILFDSNQAGLTQYHLYLIDTDGSNIEQLLEGRYPTVSPTGLIAFANNQNIYTWDGTNINQLTQDSGSNYNPAFSPDGSQLAFVSNREGDWEIFKMDINGENQTQMTHNNLTDSLPAWCSDTEIIYSSYRGNFDIYKTDGTTQTPILTTPASEYLWDCKLERFLYAKFTVDGDIEIFRTNLDLTNEARLTHVRGNDQEASFK